MLENKDRLNDYMTVYFLDTREEMYNIVDKVLKEKVERDYDARTQCFSHCFYDENDDFVKFGRCCGYIFFNDDDNLKFYTVSHEASHAVLGYFTRKLQKYKNIMDEIDENHNVLKENTINEELYCYMLGGICDQITYEYDKYLQNKEKVL